MASTTFAGPPQVTLEQHITALSAGKADPTVPEPSIDRMFNVVEISNGYLIVPHPHYQGERVSLAEAMFAETPQKLGEMLALWVTGQILGRS